MKDPAFLFYSQDFYIGTIDMDFEDVGKYIRILCVMHQKGRLKEETIRLLVGNVSVSLKEKFQIDSNGLWYNERLEQETEKRANFVESRRLNGSMGGRPKASGKPNGKPSEKLKTNLGENENEIENNSINVSFETFWNLYDKKIGSKPKCEKKWNKLTDQERQKIIDTLPDWKASIKDKQFQPYPETYLNNQRWNDEVDSIKKQESYNERMRRVL